MAKTPAWQRKEGKVCATIGTCKNLTPILFATQKTFLLLFAPNVARTNRYLHTIRIANAKTARLDIDPIVKLVAETAQEKTGQDLYTPRCLVLGCSSVKFATLPKYLEIFTLTDVLQTVQKNIVRGAKFAYLTVQNSLKQLCMLAKQNNVLHPPKISYLGYSTTQQNVNSIWVLILTLCTCCAYMSSNRADALYLEST